MIRRRSLALGMRDDQLLAETPGQRADVVHHHEHRRHEHQRQDGREHQGADHGECHRRAEFAARADGIMPAAIAMVVMTIGRARFMPASMIASSRGLPSRIDSTANSTSMMAFLVTMPISIRMPIHTGVVSCLPVTSSATIAPPIESGSENRMVIGCRKVPNSSTSTAYTIISPAVIAVAKPSDN